MLRDWLAADRTARTSLDTFAEAPFTSGRLGEDLIGFTYLLGHFDQPSRIDRS
ncbi:hypothetical protein ACWIGI_38605 [Nocardia sp. NPDC055321]